MNVIQQGKFVMYKSASEWADKYESRLKPINGADEIVRQIKENIDSITRSPDAGTRSLMKIFTRNSNKRLLKNLFKETDKLFLQLDCIVNSLGINNFDLYLKYRNARKLPTSGGSSHSLIGLIKDKASNTPLKGVTVTLQLNGNKPVIKKSASMGGFRLKNLPPGMYTVTGEKLGYLKETTEVAISDNVLSTVLIAMERAIE